MLKIQEIISRQPLKITVRFNNNEIKVIDFSELAKKYPALSNPVIFASVELDDYPTLSWKGLSKMKDYDGSIIDAPLDFCPDMLYEISEK